VHGLKKVKEIKEKYLSGEMESHREECNIFQR
jgi:hypothetical protein